MIYGSFRSINDIKYTVYIDCSLDYEIGSSNMINFVMDPITIKQDVDDTFEHIIKTQCTITLITNTYLGDYLYSANDRGISVMVYKTTSDNNECLFSGYVEPLSFSQDFATEYTEIELVCNDWLSTLENHRYRETEDYDDVCKNADIVTFKEVINDVLDNGDETKHIWHDGTILVNYASGDYAIKELSIAEALLLGDEEDDLWTCEEVLFEILQYMNLHIVQRGNDFYIFSYSSIKNKDSIRWLNLNKRMDSGDSTSYKDTNRPIITIDETYYKGKDTNVSISDVYNKIVVECDLQEVEDLFVSPLEDDDLISPYDSRYHFLTETYKENPKHDWYFQYLNNDNWTFRYIDSTDNTVHDFRDWVNSNCKILNSSGQYVYYGEKELLEKIHDSTLGAFLGSYGKVDAIDADDNTIKNDLDMTPTIMIPIHGSKINNNGASYSEVIDRSEYFTNAINLYKEAGGMIEYKSNKSLGLLSPTDGKTINYIVFSGKVYLQPKAPVSVSFNRLEYFSGSGGSTTNHFENPKFDYEDWRNGDNTQYKGACTDDTLSKVPLLLCQLKVGDKYACEVDSVNNFVWKTQEEIDAYNADKTEDTEWTNTFTLGFNPAKGDYFVCKEWDISNTISVDMNVEDEEGTAIPIKYTDNLSGPIEFRVLGVYYYNHTDTNRKHPTMFRHTSYWTTNLLVMEWVNELFITDFECKIVTNNGGIDNCSERDNDLIYMSDETNDSIQSKDDITFKFNTALSSVEAKNKGIGTGTKLSSVIVNSTRVPVRTLYNTSTNNNAKAEENYIDDYYTEYSKPMVIVETTFDGNKTDYWDRFKFSYFPDKNFMTIATEYNLKNDTKTFKIKEYD